MRRIAVFDFDGTLSTRDVLIEFLIRFGGPWAVLRSLTANPRLVIRVLAGRASRDELKAAVLADVLAGRPRHDLELAGIEFAHRVRTKRLRRDMLDRLAWHRYEGHETVIVSASLEAYLIPLALDLGVDHVIAVRLDADESGRLTGEMAGGNVRGTRKAVLLSEWIDGTPAEVWAYGDSPGDRELLAMADHPVWVGRRRGCRTREATLG